MKKVIKKIRIGFVGCGAISGIYFKNITGLFDELEIAGVCDLIPERAQNAAEEYGISRIYSDMHELFSDPNVDIVLNLTRPYEHFEVTKAALLAGKNVYSEKPLGASLGEGVELMRLAKEKGLMIGGAPDTFLGAGIQTCRKLIDDGFIGEPLGASAYMVCRGHETWHPDPEFYYKYGGGPMMDMGPYYLTAMVSLLGGISSVTGMSKTSFDQRTITSQPHYGDTIDVEVSTYVTGLMQFESGAIGTIFTTFDVYKSETPRIEIYGSKGTLSVPDPNTFGGPVRLLRGRQRGEESSFVEMPLLFPYAQNSRALGLADMAKAIATGREFRACGDLTLHVLEVMCGFETASKSKTFVQIESKLTKRPQMMRDDNMKGVLED
ncbi:MAG: Gfo/Idh/MocA family protein [Christensenellales bacterium]|jgi:predicted dehydrogenase